MAAASDDALESAVLSAVAGDARIDDTFPWAAARGAEHGAVLGVVNSLTADGYVVTEALAAEFWELTAEAAGYVLAGSPEAQVFAAVPPGAGGATEAELRAALGDALVAIGLGKCMKNKWVARDKASGRYARAVEAVGADELADQLRAVAAGSVGDAALLKDLKKRQLVVLV